MQVYRAHIMVCSDTGCASAGAGGLVTALEKSLTAHGLTNQIQVVKTGCFGFCSVGPLLVVHPDRIMYAHVTPEDIDEIVTEHLINGRHVERLLLGAQTGSATTDYNLAPFFAKQVRIATRNCGVIDPASLEDYIGRDGYLALGQALFDMTPATVVSTIKASGLRGRGGAGFPTGLKWELTAKEGNPQKYVCCNADEGDPGAFMDRSLLEGDPHSILEAMAICGYAIGSDKGFIYIRAEYPSAIRRLTEAIAQAKEAGLLGDNILGSDFSFDIELRLGAGAFVCGEETALIASLEGGRGEPTNKPPYPAQSGIYGCPTVVNNVETFANICAILLKGSDWFSSIGTERSKGTKVFALAGKVNNVGLVEVPMGTTLREIVFEIGGGIKQDRAFKAVQTGGPSGGCIPAAMLDTEIDYESLTAAGSMMGSGGMIILDETDCMVNIAKFYLEFTVDESCGRCTPCRIGNKRLYEILSRITSGQGTMRDLQDMQTLGETIRDTSLCALGMSAPNPVLSTMRYFPEEYEAHVLEKKCPAGVCTDLLSYHIDPDKCIGCTLCDRNCPVHCISGERGKAHTIDQSKCIKCGLCISKCQFGAIVKH